MAGNASSTNIQITVLDSNGNPTLLIGQANSVTVKLVNQTGVDIALKASAPSGTPPAGFLQIQLFLDAFFTDPDAAAGVVVSGNGWSAAYLDDIDFPCWSVAPTSDRIWAVNGAILLTISRFQPTVQVGSYYLTADLWSLPNARSPMAYNATVGVQTPTPAGAQTLRMVLKATLDTSAVCITKNPKEPESNDLVLTLVNENPTSPLVPDDVPWGSSPPQFIISFIYGDQAPGNFALCRPDAAASIEVGLKAGGGWTVTRLDGPRWLLQPTESNHNVLGTFDAAVVSFSIDNIVTQFTAGPTLMYLQCLNMPRYGDTFYAMLLNKQYKPLAMGPFTINKPSFVLNGATPAKAYLTWSVTGSTLVELSGVGPVESTGLAVEVEVDRTTPFVLTAYDIFTSSIQTASVVAQVTPDFTTRWLPIGTIVVWNGPSRSVPAGYVLCDGRNGTPDLRDLFVLGAGGGTAPQTRMGDHHVHGLPGLAARTFTTGTENIGAHTHGMPTNWYARGLSCGVHPGVDTNGDYSRSTRSGTNSTSHTHTVTVDFNSPATGPAHGGTRPAWYALCYIMLPPAAAA